MIRQPTETTLHYSSGCLALVLLIHLGQGCQTQDFTFCGPTRALKEYNMFNINYMSHNASQILLFSQNLTLFSSKCHFFFSRIWLFFFNHFVTFSLKRLLLSDVVNYEVITLSDNNPMQRQSCHIIHYLIYIEYLYMYFDIVLKLQPAL